MKIGIFTDVRYGKQPQIGHPNKTLQSLQRLKVAMSAFKKQHVDLCFCMGNLIDQKNQDRAQVLKCFRETMELIRSYEIPFYLVPGPHEYLTVSAQELLELEELYTAPYTVHTESVLFILLDGNYRPTLQHCNKNDFETADFFLPPSQIEYLKKRSMIMEQFVLLLHQSIDSSVPSKFTVQNAEEIREIISNSRRAKLVVQGGYPKGADNVIDGVRYLNVPSMCENETDFYRIVDI